VRGEFYMTNADLRSPQSRALLAESGDRSPRRASSPIPATEPPARGARRTPADHLRPPVRFSPTAGARRPRSRPTPVRRDAGDRRLGSPHLARHGPLHRLDASARLLRRDRARAAPTSRSTSTAWSTRSTASSAAPPGRSPRPPLGASPKFPAERAETNPAPSTSRSRYRQLTPVARLEP
jgi:hypothetical protein